MNYRMIAADMDGTLLNDASELTQRTKNAVIKAADSGIIFVTATGRALQGVEIVNKLFRRDMPFIIFNGAAVVMGKSRSTLFTRFLDPTLALEACGQGIERGMPVILWTDKNLWASHKCRETLAYSEYYNIEMKYINNAYEFMEEEVYKLLWIGRPGDISRFQHEMNNHFLDRLNCHSSRPTMLEFVSPDAEKGAAMAELGRRYGIDRSEMVAIGDGYNDISMLKYAGLGIAMENAPDEVKSSCAHVTSSNNEDGVAEALDKHVF